MSDSRRVISVLLLTSFLSYGTVASGQSNGTPVRIESQIPGLPPLWVSASAALDASGELTNALGPGARERLRKLATPHRQSSPSSESNGPCRTYIGMPSLEHFKPTDTAEDLLSGSEHVFAGTVVASGDGFYLEIPGRLLTIELDGPPLQSPAAPPDESQSPIFLFFADARILTPSVAYCSLPASDVRLQPGDQVILFAMTKGDDAEGRSFRALPSKELAIQTADGRLVLPDALRNDPRFNSLTDLSAVVRVLNRVSLDSGTRLEKHACGYRAVGSREPGVR